MRGVSEETVGLGNFVKDSIADQPWKSDTKYAPKTVQSAPKKSCTTQVSTYVFFQKATTALSVVSTVECKTALRKVTLGSRWVGLLETLSTTMPPNFKYFKIT